MKKDDVILLSIAIIVAGIIILNIASEDTILGVLTESLREPEWEELNPRDVVKNVIPITVLERDGNCLVSAEKLDLVFDHEWFTKREQLERKLNYDREKNTINVGCDKLINDKMNFHIWFIIPDAPKHAGKFIYFTTDSSIGASNATIPK